MTTEISIARQFSTTPGGRNRRDGPASGEEFRVEHLEPHFQNRDDDSPITVILDGTAEGFATSFLEEAFGGLARLFGTERCRRRLRFVSEEDAGLPFEIEKYIREGVEGPSRS